MADYTCNKSIKAASGLIVATAKPKRHCKKKIKNKNANDVATFDVTSSGKWTLGQQC